MDDGVHDVASGVMLRVGGAVSVKEAVVFVLGLRVEDEELVGQTLLDFVGFADGEVFAVFAFDRAGDGHLGIG